MKKRYCDFCNDEIEMGKSFIKLIKIDYKQGTYKTYSGKVKTHQIYPQKVIGDMCLKCKDKLKGIKL